jgi:23S rRNA pseudouridine955/2504/2580 synthase
MKEIIINQNDSGQRLDKFLTKAFPLLPLSLMQKEIRRKNIKVNGKRAQNGQILNINDNIKLFINDEFFVTEPKEIFKSVSGKLTVIYAVRNTYLKPILNYSEN